MERATAPVRDGTGTHSAPVWLQVRYSKGTVPVRYEYGYITSASLGSVSVQVRLGLQQQYGSGMLQVRVQHWFGYKYSIARAQDDTEPVGYLTGTVPVRVE